MTIPAYPLQWPAGWKRTPSGCQSRARFSTKERQYRSYTNHDGTVTNNSWSRSKELTIADAVSRVRSELQRMGLDDGYIVISTNLALRLDGLPRSRQSAPDDPGAAVYWRDKTSATRCMAVDRYDRVADNLAAIAATLDAMRAIERHGGAEILDRAFTGFLALGGPESAQPWHVVFGVPAGAPIAIVRSEYRALRSENHPDRGGDPERFHTIQAAWKSFCAAKGIDP